MSEPKQLDELKQITLEVFGAEPRINWQDSRLVVDVTIPKDMPDVFRKQALWHRQTNHLAEHYEIALLLSERSGFS